MNNRIKSKNDALAFLKDKVSNTTKERTYYDITEDQAIALKKQFGAKKKKKLSKIELGVGISKLTNKGLYTLLFRDVPKFNDYYNKNFIADDVQKEKTPSNNEELNATEVKTSASANNHTENNNNNNCINNNNNNKRKRESEDIIQKNINFILTDNSVFSFPDRLSKSDSETTNEKVESLNPPSP